MFATRNNLSFWLGLGPRSRPRSAAFAALILTAAVMILVPARASAGDRVPPTVLGHVLWSGDSIDSVVSNNVVYSLDFGKGAGNSQHVVAADAATGSVRWTEPVAMTNEAYVGLAVTDGVVVVTQDFGDGADPAKSTLTAFTASTGARVWTRPITLGVFAYEGNYQGNVYGFNGTFYAEDMSCSAAQPGACTAGLLAIDAHTGALQWSKPLAQSDPKATISDMKADGGSLYVNLAFSGSNYNEGEIYSLDAATGAVNYDFPTGEFPTRVSIAGGMLFYIDGDVVARSEATGAVLWSIAPDGSSATSGPDTAGGVVYVGAFSGRLVGLNATTGASVFTADRAAFDPELAAEDGALYVGAQHQIIAVSLSGSHARWAVNVPNPQQWFQITVIRGVVYARASDLRLYVVTGPNHR